MSDIIELTDTARLRIEQDQDAENPRKEVEMATGFVKIGQRGDSRLDEVPAVHEDTARLHDAYYHMLDTSNIYHTDILFRAYIHAETLVARYARIFHGLHVEYDHEHGGFWFVAPAEIKINVEHGGDWSSLEKQAEVIKQERETYRQWAEGEVSGVILERKHGYTRDDDPSIGIEQWEQEESIWGNYLDDDYTPQVVADEFFDLTEEETAALALPERQRPETPAAIETVSGEY